MKIALYAGSYVKDKDGAVKSIYQLVSSFRKSGHEVAIWSPDISSSQDGAFAVHKVRSVPVPLYPDYRLGFGTSETKRQIEQFDPDIIHISTPDIVGRLFLLYAKNKKLPVVSAYHTDFPSYLSYYHLGFTVGSVWKYLAWFYNTCDVVLAPNECVRQKLASRGINTVEIWSRGVDKGLFDPSRRSAELRRQWGAEERTVIVYAGRFVIYKDVQIVTGLYKRFMAEGFADRVKFVMIGSGPEEHTLRAQMPEAFFAGYLTGAELAHAYASGDIFLFPSTTEAFCNVVLEALASGLPSVVSDIGGCMELVNDARSGLVATAGDMQKFYGHCLRLMEDDAMYQQMRAKGLAFAESKSWSSINSSVISRYQQLVNSHAH
jgi:glycosyltransferase involved in cell wall biosynthesis